MGRTNTPPDLLPGTLDLLILRTLATGAKHGYGIAERLRQVSDHELAVQMGGAVGARAPAIAL